MAKLTVGTDLSGETITNVAPDGITGTINGYDRTIARVGSNIRIYENRLADVFSGNVYADNGEEIFLYTFYSYDIANDTQTYNRDFTLPDWFGVVTEVDETSLLFPYLSREEHVRLYAATDDMRREEIGRTFSGENLPDSTIGKAGDIYLKY